MWTSLADHKTGLDRSLYQLKRTGRSDQFAQLTTLHTTCTYDTPTERAHTYHVHHLLDNYTLHGCFPRVLRVLEHLNIA